MIPLSEIYDDLAYGELANISISGAFDGSTGVSPSDYPTIIRHINTCLSDLFSRFDLREKQIVVREIAGQVNYKLHSDYAISNSSSTEPVRWIIDTTEDPFEDDIVRVLTVRKPDPENAGHWIVLPLDDYFRYDPDDRTYSSVFMSSYNVLSVPQPLANEELTLRYRARHPRIDPLTVSGSVRVDIPETLREPLLWYITSRIFASRTGQDDRALSAEYMQRYSIRCDELERNGVFSTVDESANIKFSLGGWR